MKKAKKISKQIEDKREQTMSLFSDDQLLRKIRENENDERRYVLSLCTIFAVK
jgi:hypothetical protein